jgi:MMP 1-O-methyltransferase
MDFNKLNALKGFMPLHEGEALAKWSEEFSILGPALEIGTFGGKSSLFIAAGTSKHEQVVFTIDHHSGSEEHQSGEEYFDSTIYDESLGRVNTLPLMQFNLQQFDESRFIVPIIANANLIARLWTINLGLLFIDGSHTEMSAQNDYANWNEKIITGGALVIHDIFENPEEGGQAPFLIYQKALSDGYTLHERVDTIACLIKK